MLALFGIPFAAILSVVFLCVIFTLIGRYNSVFLIVVPLFPVLGILFFIWYAKSDTRKKNEESADQAYYVTDWKGNSILLYGNFFMPFSESLFTFQEWSPLSRTTQEVRSLGFTKANLTIQWRPNPKFIDVFMKGSEAHKASYLIEEYVKDLISDNGVEFLYPKKHEKWEEINYDSLGIIVTYRSVERTEPLITLENEEEWLKYEGYEIGVLDDEPVFLDDDSYAAHIQIIGASRFGKSKLIEHIARQMIHHNHYGLCILDPNQQLYDDILTWCVHRGYADGTVHFLDLSDEKSTIGFNPFKLKGVATPQRITAQANRLLRTTLKALGIHADSAIQAQRIIRCLYYVVIEQNLPITELKAFFSPRHFDRRDEIMSHCQSEDIRDQWEMLTAGKKDDAYISMMQSSANRLFDFVSEGGVQKLFTNPHQIDFAEISEKGEVVVINLGKSDIMPVAARNVIGTFLIDEIWEIMSARNREQVEKIPQFNLMVDEFQNFATPDFAEMLKEGAKYRLHLWLINHVLSDLDRDVKNALNACHMKMAFGGTMQQDAAFVLEGSFPRVRSELKLDIEAVPRLSKRQFMLRRPEMNNVICETPEVNFYPVKKSDKERYLNELTRMPSEIVQPAPSQPKPTISKNSSKPVEDKSKGEEVPPDEFYY